MSSMRPDKHTYFLYLDGSLGVPLKCVATQANLIKEAVKTVCQDPGFSLPSPQASASLSCAKTVEKWIDENYTSESYISFCENIIHLVTQCLPPAAKMSRKERAKLWKNLFQLQISAEFSEFWETFLTSIKAEVNVLFYQHLTDVIAELLIQRTYQITANNTELDMQTDDLTYNDINVIRYVPGYIPRALKKKLSGSAHPLKQELIEHLDELVVPDPNEDISGDASTDWINLIDRGGLIHVNEMMYQMMKQMEIIVRPYLKSESTTLNDDAIKAICLDDNVLFYWELLSGMWEVDERDALFKMIIELWVTIRGFAYASGWLEHYKQTIKTSLQKSKGVRKKLIE